MGVLRPKGVAYTGNQIDIPSLQLHLWGVYDRVRKGRLRSAFLGQGEEYKMLSIIGEQVKSIDLRLN